MKKTKLYYFRKNANMTLKDVFAKTGICVQTLSRYERNEREPKMRNLKILANLYNVTVDDIIEEDK